MKNKNLMIASMFLIVLFFVGKLFQDEKKIVEKKIDDVVKNEFNIVKDSAAIKLKFDKSKLFKKENNKEIILNRINDLLKIKVKAESFPVLQSKIMSEVVTLLELEKNKIKRAEAFEALIITAEENNQKILKRYFELNLNRIKKSQG